MDMNHIRWFCAAYDRRSFSKAAESAFVSRQAFGKAMRGLEKELGLILFERGSLGSVPTEAARAVYPYMKACLKRYDEALDQIASFKSGQGRRMRIAFSDSVPSALPDDLFPALEKAFPHVDFVLEKHFAPHCLDLVKEGAVDFAVSSYSVRDQASLCHIHIASHPLNALFRRDLADFSLDSPTLEDLSHLTFFLLGNRFPGDDDFIELFASHGLELKLNTRYVDYDLIIEKVMQGEGATLAPSSTLERFDDASLVAVPFPSSDIAWNLGVVYEPELEDALVRSIIQFMEERY
ncbi:LysR family transcriptional regulator [Slackia exigua]|uniref:LysR family transcriptional regulator n=1 Tax=Slackia exigua TaxID=84109 RepID=UPI002006AA9D|nr:LysR family transcriptional regulator [Slackia exigua]MCK6138398.1 LysR family transcriptional regulator [Slackia exigua]